MRVPLILFASLAFATAVVLAFAACGGDEPADEGRPAAVDRPASDPPERDSGYPPPAWISTRRGSYWLAYATFCWESVCVDSTAPRCGDAHVPDVPVARGEEVTFHLGFDPMRATLQVFDEDVMGVADPLPLPKGRAIAWTVDRGGPVWLSTDAGGGRDAHYAACLRLEGEDERDVPLSVAEALERRPAGGVAVRGLLYVRGDEVLLCDALAESHPPQCSGERLRVEGYPVDAASGLARAGDVAWSEAPATLRGRLRGTTLVIAST